MPVKMDLAIPVLKRTIFEWNPHKGPPGATGFPPGQLAFLEWGSKPKPTEFICCQVEVLEVERQTSDKA